MHYSSLLQCPHLLSVMEAGFEQLLIFPFFRLAELVEGPSLNFLASLATLVWVQTRCSAWVEQFLYGLCPSCSGEAAFLLDGKPGIFLSSWRDKCMLRTWSYHGAQLWFWFQSCAHSSSLCFFVEHWTDLYSLLQQEQLSPFPLKHRLCCYNCAIPPGLKQKSVSNWIQANIRPARRGFPAWQRYSTLCQAKGHTFCCKIPMIFTWKKYLLFFP